MPSEETVSNRPRKVGLAMTGLTNRVVGRRLEPKRQPNSLASWLPTTLTRHTAHEG